MLLGVWLSTFVLLFIGRDFLIFMSIIGGGVCFLGFMHYYGKANSFFEKQKKQERDTELVDKGLVKSNSRFW